RVDARPGPETDVGIWTLEVAEQPGVRAQALSVTPVRPLFPAPHELRLAARLHMPGRMRVRLGHSRLPRLRATGSMLAPTPVAGTWPAAGAHGRDPTADH